MATRSRSPRVAFGSTVPNLGPNGSAYAALAEYAAEQEYRQLANSDLSDRIVVVVGAAVDVANATAIRLARHGAQVILLDAGPSRDRLNTLAAQCDAHALHGNKWQFRANKWQRVQKAVVHTVDAHTDLGAVVANVVDTFGRIDALVFKAPNAPPAFGVAGSIVDPSVVGQLERSMSAELLQFVRLIQLVLPHLEQSGGTVVNISTTLSLFPKANQLASAMTRSAIDMLVKCICLELGPKKIRINSVLHLQPSNSMQQTSLANGLEVNQSMVDQYLQQIEKDHVGQRVLRPDDVATAVLYLLSPRSSFLNGANIVVDGGKIWMSQV